MEYVNMIPDMSRYMDVNESSFMRGMPNNSSMFISNQKTNPDSEQHDRIQELQTQLTEHKKHIEELVNASGKASSNTDCLSSDGDMVKRSEFESLQNAKQRETTKLSEQIKILAAQHELERIHMQTEMTNEIKEYK